jgi:iron-sulfur cluster repair protein YtfE (RIC family)
MKRHTQLQPLSRAHHQTLRLARSFKWGNLDEVALHQSLVESQASLEAHFAEEESRFSELTELVAEGHPLRAMLAQMNAEHIVIMAEVLRIIAQSGQEPRSSYQALGNLLSEHIAFEEKALFPSLEAHCLNTQPLNGEQK